MRHYFNKPLLVALLLTSTICGHQSFAQRLERDKDEISESVRHTRPKQWPAQVISSQVVPMSTPQVVNWKNIVDYQNAHPQPSRTGFIGQIEDKDAEFEFTPHTIPAGTPTFDPARLPGARNGAQRQRNSPAPLGYFLGTAGNGSLIPPDVAGAAGLDYVLEVNNQQFDLYTKAGVHHSTINMDNFFTGGVAGGFFDPHILYDNFHNQFIIVIDGNIAGNNDGGLFIAVSQTSDPTGSWWTYKIDNGDPATADLLDYPQIGFNKNWVVITANYFVGNATTGDIYVLNRDSLESGSLGTVTLFTDNNAFSWAPAETHDTTTNTLWMVQDGNGGSGAMQIGSITGTATTPVYNAGGNIAVTSLWNENAVDVQQKGGGTTQLINDDDTRVGNGSVFVNGQLWFTHGIWLPATGVATNAGVDWWEVNPSAMTVTQFGRIAAPTNGATVANYYYPTLNVNGKGDALLGYCISSGDSLYASSAYSFHAAADAPNTMQSRYIYKPGVATYYQTLGGGRNRYGDYTGTVVDPVDSTFWNFSEWAPAATTWGTVIAHIPTSAPPTSAPVVSFTATPTLNTCGGLVNFTDQSSNAPSAWLWNFGDGGTSTQEFPSHQYTANGNYTVTLTATNVIGSDSQTVTNYITINLPTAPSAVGQTHCRDSVFTLTASNTTSGVAWFDSTGTFLSSANPFVTPLLTQTTTYWVQDSATGPVDSVGPASITTLGGNATYTRTRQHGLIFDAPNGVTIISVNVNASVAGSRTIEVLSGTTVVATTTVTLTTGLNVVPLNFNIPAGSGYEMTLPGGTAPNLTYNNAVAAGSYPFTIAGVVSITGPDAGANYYYFYDWKVQGAPCASARTAATAVVTACTGIENVSGGIKFSVYPNPAMTEVTVDLQGIYENTVVSLKDMLGQTLSSHTVTGQTLTLDLVPYTEGVYFVEVAQAGKVATQKLIISK